MPEEVKCREIKRAEVSRSMRIFIKRYEPDETWIANLTLKFDEKMGEKEFYLCHFLKWYEIYSPFYKKEILEFF